MMKHLIFIFFLLSPFLGYSQNNEEEALANHYYLGADYEKAATIYQQLYDRTSGDSYYEPLFNSLLKSNQFEAAEKIARKLSRQFPNNDVYLIHIGRVYQESGRQEKANDWFNSLIKNLKDNEIDIRELATSFYRAEAYEYAIKTFLVGRKLIKNPQAFAFDLLSLYRFRKDKNNLTEEYLNVLPSNPTMLQQAQMMLSTVYEDNEDYDFLQAELLKRIQKDPKIAVFAELLAWQYIQKKEFDRALRQILALDKGLKENGERVYDLCQLLINNKSYENAIEGLTYIIAKGSSNQFFIASQIDMLNARMKLVTSGKYTNAELLAIEKEYTLLLQQIGKQNFAALAILQLANLKAYYLNKPEEAETLYEELLKLNGLPQSISGQAKLELGDIYILTGEVWEATLMYGQVEKQFKGENLGQEAKFRNAKLSYFLGDFIWAKAQADVLKSSTSQLIANDALNLSLMLADNLQEEKDSIALRKYAYADLQVFKNKFDDALKVLDTIENQDKASGLMDDILMLRSKIYLKKNDFTNASVFLQEIIANYSFGLWGDDALFMLADLSENKLNNPEKAKKLYEKIILDYPGSLFVIEARKRFRNLRGDKVENPS